ncbi:MAG: hypothetical protein MJZ11_08250 [Lachnospiraceae bacterium]|nr:hypothetical protein [Lachnospiraceae bacterium]
MMDQFCYEQIAQAVNSLNEINESLKKISKEKDDNLLCISGNDLTTTVYVNKNDCFFRNEYCEIDGETKKQIAVINKYTGECIGTTDLSVLRMYFPEIPKEN